MSRTVCPSCGAAARGKFCSECGARVDGGCPGCGTPVAPGVRFCPRCGTSVRAAPSGAAPLAGGFPRRYAAPAFAAVGLLVAAVVFLLVRDEPLPTSNPAATTATAGAAAPDISNMSPRERAARLYDRVMQYAEQGRQDSVAFFAPMALAAHESLPELDADARYDYGRIAAAAGDLALAQTQADSILASAPTHLLGLALAARVADAGGKGAQARALWEKFSAQREREVARQLPEYVAHASDIDAATRDAARLLGTTPAKAPGVR